MKKIKDLSPGLFLGNFKIKTPKGVVGYWKSQWEKGVWFSDGKTNIIYPQFVDDLRECLEWKITDDPVNCNILTGMEHIDNYKEPIK